MYIFDKIGEVFDEYREGFRQGLIQAKEKGTVIAYITAIRAERARIMEDNISSPDEFIARMFSNLNAMYEIVEQIAMEEILSPDEIQAVNGI